MIKSMKWLPWIMAGMWFVARIIAGKFLGVENAQVFGVLSNILLVLILIFVAIYSRYKDPAFENKGFASDLKACMFVALKYVLAAVISIGLYYGVISDDLRVMREAHIQAFNDGIQDETNFAQFKKDHPELKDSTREQLIQTNKENVERNVAVQPRVLGSLLALTFVSFVYSLLAVFFWRSVVKRF